MTNFVRGDVFFMNLEGNAHVQGGWRPYVVIQNNLGNKYSQTTIVAPMTSRVKRLDMKTHVALYNGRCANHHSVVLLEQIRVVNVDLDSWRWVERLSNEDMQRIDKAIKISLGVE